MLLVFGYVLVYMGIVALLSYFIYPNLALVAFGLAFMVIGIVMIAYAPYRPNRNTQLRQQVEDAWWYDWYYFLDIPFRMVWWLARSIKHIFG